jgi:hypothetical protein
VRKAFVLAKDRRDLCDSVETDRLDSFFGDVDAFDGEAVSLSQPANKPRGSLKDLHL